MADYGSTEAVAPSRRPHPISGQRVESLATLVEGEIIPRLMAAHGFATARATARTGLQVSPSEVEPLALLALGLDAAALLSRIEQRVLEGVAVDMVLVELLAPAARLLGAWWEEDRCDFVEVTMGLWRLQEVARELTVHHPPLDRSGERRRRALFAAMPGDQHSFGTVLIDEIFRRHGWDSRALLDPTGSDLLAASGERALDLIGLTVSCDCHIARLPSLIRAIRSVARNPGVRIMAGGRIFVERPELAIEVGADGTAADARSAVAVADGLVAVSAGGVLAGV